MVQHAQLSPHSESVDLCGVEDMCEPNGSAVDSAADACYDSYGEEAATASRDAATLRAYFASAGSIKKFEERAAFQQQVITPLHKQKKQLQDIIKGIADSMDIRDPGFAQDILKSSRKGLFALASELQQYRDHHIVVPKLEGFGITLKEMGIPEEDIPSSLREDFSAENWKKITDSRLQTLLSLR